MCLNGIILRSAAITKRVALQITFDARSRRPRAVPLTRARGPGKHPVSIRWKQCCQTPFAHLASAARNKQSLFGTRRRCSSDDHRMEGGGKLVSCRQDISAIVSEQAGADKHKVGLRGGGLQLALVRRDDRLFFFFFFFK